MKGKVISLNSHPKFKAHKITGYTYNLMTGEFYGLKGQVLKRINDGYYKIHSASKTERTASDKPKSVSLRRADVVYWYWHQGMPDAMPNNFAEKCAKLELMVDHINRNRLDDRIDNLRLTDYSGNMQNRPGCDRLNDPEFRRSVAECYNAGTGRNQVAREYKIRRDFVKKCVIEFGYRMRPVGGAVRSLFKT